MGKMMTVLALALAAPAAFAAAQSQAQVEALRVEIKRDGKDLGAKWKAGKSQRQALLDERKAELAKVKTGPGSKEEKKAARRAIREKYAKLLKEVGARRRAEGRWIREDMRDKGNQILRLREKP